VSTYYRRISYLSLGLALATALTALAGSRLAARGREVAQPITVVAQSPNGMDVPLESAISITFSRSVDPESAEAAFVLVPPVPGTVTWQGQTLFFTPSQPFAPQTWYRVTIRPGVTDLDGYVNPWPTSWPFRTR
jgi:hypothetical protein